MILTTLAILGLLLALLPAVLFLRNLSAFHRLLPFNDAGTASAVSVLIPARNEERSIAAAVQSALASTHVNLELIVLDDHSEDQTARVVAEIAQRDARVRLVPAPQLPPNWSGKQHACHVLSKLATHDLLVWMDADVRLKPDALARMITAINDRGPGLLSVFPHQQTGTWLEKLLLPLMHFVLLGFLPLRIMRRMIQPSLGAGCGQLMMARRDAYLRSGGHAAIRGSFHDGIQLPRAFRRAGVMTDLFDGTDAAECRMYRGAGQTWRGLLKNAGEAMASPPAIGPWTVLLIGGQVVPAVTAVVLGFQSPITSLPFVLCSSAWALGILMRAVAAARFRQSWLGVALHPLSVLLLVLIQWHSLLLHIRGRRTTWKGRSAPPLRA